MRAHQLDVRGFEGRQVPNALWQREGGAGHLGVLFPGWSYGGQAPLLYYARRLLFELGADVLLVEYAYDRLPGFSSLSGGEQDEVFFAETGAALNAAEEIRSHERFTLIGKSIGTQAVLHLLRTDPRLAAARGVLLTPTLAHDGFPEALARIQQPCLSVLGTADPHYAEDRLAALRARGPVTVVEGADHALDVPGSVAASIDALKDVIESIRSFLQDD